MATLPTPPGHIRLMENRGHLFLPVADITRLEGCNKCVKLHMATGNPYLTTLTMNTLLQRYPGEFIRIDRSHAVRLSDIVGVGMKRKRIVLADGAVLPMSELYANEAWEEWQAYLIGHEV